jgi:uncharacterized delta-60 repeat protein
VLLCIKIFHSFILAFTFFLSSHVFAQVSLDTTFGNNGIVITPTANSSEINAIALQPDGKIVAAGYWNNSGTYHFQIARYNIDGTLDNTFGNGGVVNTSIGNSSMPFSIQIQPDGKIVVAGGVKANLSPPFQYHSLIVRYNTDGNLDNNFGTGGIVITIADSIEDGIASIVLQPDGKIIAGGYAWNQFLLMRYNTDGSLDNTFGTGGMVKTSIEGTESSIWAITQQPDGKIVAAGTTGDINNLKFALARYNNNGILDTSFGIAGAVSTDFNSVSYDIATSIALISGGKILLAGYSDSNIAMAKYNNDGTLDVNFGTGGKVSSSNFPSVPPNSVIIQTDGKIITGGSVIISPYNYGYSLTRFDTSGIPDNSFGVGGNIKVDVKTGNDYVQCLILQPDDKIIVAGSSKDGPSIPADFTLVRFNSDVNTNIYDYTIPEIKIIAYPNPAQENIKIDIDDDIKITDIRLFDVNGKLVNFYLPNETVLNLSGLAKGKYSLLITTDKGAFVHQIVKQ